MSELSQQFMALLIQLSVALLAIIASAISHYRILQYLTKFIVRLRNGARGLIVLFCGIAASQLLAALWFTFAFKVSIAIDLRPVDLCCTYFTQQYIGNHIIENASETILA